jgi:hypothetical protein
VFVIISELASVQPQNQPVSTHFQKSPPSGTVYNNADTKLAIQFNNDRHYWKEVLKRIIAVIKCLASRGLPLREDNQTIGLVRNGNYLGIMELLSQFDPFLG